MKGMKHLLIGFLGTFLLGFVAGAFFFPTQTVNRVQRSYTAEEMTEILDAVNAHYQTNLFMMNYDPGQLFVLDEFNRRVPTNVVLFTNPIPIPTNIVLHNILVPPPP